GVEAAREKPVPEMGGAGEEAEKMSLEVASGESNSAAADFAAPLADLPKTPDLDARELRTNDNYAEVRERPDAQKEMPSPIPTEAARAGLEDPARESFLVGALAMLLLCAGVIFKLARRHTQSVRRDRRMGPRRLRPSQAVR